MSETKKISREEAIFISGETAPYRVGPSVPARLLVENNLIDGNLFDWGCGFGTDVEYFCANNIDAIGWDPVHMPDNKPELFPPGYFNYVNCAFVLNTLPDYNHRLEILREIHNFLPNNGYLILTLRSIHELKRNIRDTWITHEDGYITGKGTFQRGYTVREAVRLLEPLFCEITVMNSNPVVLAAKK